MYREGSERLRALAGRRVAVIHHDDGDGVSSGAQLVRYLRRACEVFAIGTLHAARVEPARLARVLAWQPDAVVTVDFAGELDRLAADLVAAGVGDVLLFDHHVPRLGPLPAEALHVNPRLEGRAMPAAALVHDLVALLDPGWADEAGWIAALGVLTDMGARDRPDLLHAAAARWPALLPAEALVDVTAQLRLMATPLGRIAAAVDAAGTVFGDEGLVQALEALVAASDPALLLPGGAPEFARLWEGLAALERAVDSAVTSYAGARRVGPLHVVVVDAPFSTASSVSNRLSLANPDEVVVIVENRAGHHHLSLRCQAGWADLEAGIRAAVAVLGRGRGGGHKVAAGATVEGGDLDRFLELLAAELPPGPGSAHDAR